MLELRRHRPARSAVSRWLELIQVAEKHGFDYAWTYDSHVLWQESVPLLAVAARETSKIKLGHFVTNPATRDPTVLASAYATLHDLSDGRMAMGIGRGDSAVRYIGRQPMKVAEFERACAMVREFMNGREVNWNDKDLQLKWVRDELPEIPMWIAGYGPKALAVAGRVARRRDHPARGPGDHHVDHGHRTQGGSGGRGATRRAQVHRRRAEPRHRRPRRRARSGALVPRDGLEPRHGSDRAVRHRRQLRPEGAHRLRAGAEVLRLQRPLARRGGARRVRDGRDLRPLLRHRQHRRRSRRS